MNDIKIIDGVMYVKSNPLEPLTEKLRLATNRRDAAQEEIDAVLLEVKGLQDQGVTVPADISAKVVELTAEVVE